MALTSWQQTGPGVRWRYLVTLLLAVAVGWWAHDFGHKVVAQLATLVIAYYVLKPVFLLVVALMIPASRMGAHKPGSETD